ncbi:MAG: methyltransferase domain-containing protein [Candidatus Poribacteria bacterium]|nr:methyltransferase domain-containing protein [Candidatus Poribacteria bacterium]
MAKWNDWAQTSMAVQDLIFRRVDENGVYMPHQPIYEFAPDRVLQFVEAALLLRQLDKLSFDSFLEVGCAEGFYLRLVQARYGAEVCGVDLAYSGVRRMWDYHRLDGICADAHQLPIRDRTFDVVLCSNTVEHVTNPNAVIAELMRVARKHVFIGVPQALMRKELEDFEPDLKAERDQHVHLFVEETYRKLLPTDAMIHHANALPTLVANAIYKRTIGHWGHLLPLVRLLIAMDGGFSHLMPRRTIHMLAQINLEPMHAIPSRQQDSLSRFLLSEIYERNKTELPAPVLRLGMDNTRPWRGFTVKLSDPPLAERRLSPAMLNILSCPNCQGVLHLQKNELECDQCGQHYIVRDGIPILHTLYEEKS